MPLSKSLTDWNGTGPFISDFHDSCFASGYRDALQDVMLLLQDTGIHEANIPLELKHKLWALDDIDENIGN
jgi:hypothetical protein